MAGRRQRHHLTDANTRTDSQSSPRETLLMESSLMMMTVVLLVTEHLRHQTRSYTRNPLKSILSHLPSPGKQRTRVRNRLVAIFVLTHLMMNHLIPSLMRMMTLKMELNTEDPDKLPSMRAMLSVKLFPNRPREVIKKNPVLLDLKKKTKI